MWYIGARRRRAGLRPRPLEAIVACGEHAAEAACAASAKTPVAAEPSGPSSSSTTSSTVISSAGPREAVAALDAALGAQDAGPAQRGEQLLEELDRDVAAAGELGDRHRAGVTEAMELDERADAHTATWW